MLLKFNSNEQACQFFNEVWAAFQIQCLHFYSVTIKWDGKPEYLTCTSFAFPDANNASMAGNPLAMATEVRFLHFMIITDEFTSHEQFVIAEYWT